MFLMTILVLAGILVLLLLQRGDAPLAVATTTTTATATMPRAVATTTTTATVTTLRSVATTTTLLGTSDPAALAYFAEIAGDSEYGGSGSSIHKWRTDIRIAVHGGPTGADLAALDAVITDIDAIVDTIDFEIVQSGGNVDLHFTPTSEFSTILPQYVSGNLGFFWVWWDDAGWITDAVVLVSTTDVDETERAHLLREELTQMLGLMNDSYSYPDSTFYQGWTYVTEYTPLDEVIIGMLYDPRVSAGMTVADVIDLFGS